MDNHTQPRLPYRCLPLSIANTSGWELLCPFSFSVLWNGGAASTDIIIKADDPANKEFALTRFSAGIVTMRTGHLFKTEPGWDLLITGPPNRPKHLISPLSAIVETSWVPFPGTMNWKFTRPGTVRFEKDEPFCFIMPVPHTAIDEFEIEQAPLETNPELLAEFNEWNASRMDFLKRRAAREPKAVKEDWQKHYFKGEKLDGEKIEDHVHKRRLKKPKTP